jgi:hypothetical protein
MSEGLKQTHDRVIAHLENVQHAYDLHYAELGRMATRGGDNIGDNLANALRRSQPTVAAAAAAVAATIAQYLKLRSPSEKGPMSDLDRWWSGLGNTLAEGVNTRALGAKLTEFVTPPGARLTDRDRALGLSANPQDRYNRERTLYLLEQIAKHTGATASQKPPGVPEIHVSGSTGIDASVYRSRR